MTRVEIRVAPDDPDTLNLLAGWLDRAPAVRRNGSPKRVMQQPEPGTMAGDLIDAVAVSIGLGLSAAQLIISIMTWRSTLPSRQRPTVVLERDGTRIEVRTDDPEFAAKLARELES